MSDINQTLDQFHASSQKISAHLSKDIAERAVAVSASLRAVGLACRYREEIFGTGEDSGPVAAQYINCSMQAVADLCDAIQKTLYYAEYFDLGPHKKENGVEAELLAKSVSEKSSSVINAIIRMASDNEAKVPDIFPEEENKDDLKQLFKECHGLATFCAVSVNNRGKNIPALLTDFIRDKEALVATLAEKFTRAKKLDGEIERFKVLQSRLDGTNHSIATVFQTTLLP